MKLSAKKTAIFDFDGTLVNSHEFVQPLFQELKQEMGLSELQEADFADFRDKTLHQLIKQAGVPLWKLPELVTKLHQSMIKLLPEMKFNQGLEQLLLNLKEQELQLGIMSSNSQDNIRSFLQSKDFNHFDFIYSGSSLFGKHKVLTRLLREQDLEKKEVVYVGDEVRDVEACQKIDLDFIAVDWGMNSRQLLEQYEPRFLVSSPEEIQSFLI